MRGPMFCCLGCSREDLFLVVAFTHYLHLYFILGDSILWWFLLSYTLRITALPTDLTGYKDQTCKGCHFTLLSSTSYHSSLSCLYQPTFSAYYPFSSSLATTASWGEDDFILAKGVSWWTKVRSWEYKCQKNAFFFCQREFSHCVFTEHPI